MLESDLFDLRLSDEQRMLVEPVRRFAEEEVRGAASAADEACAAPRALLEAANGLGIAAMAVPEALGGAGGERSVVAGVLVAEELGRGDMGIAMAILAPIGVANALSLWGNAEQQRRHLPRFVEQSAFAAAVAIAEPKPLFDPFELATRATREAGGFVLDGTKALVPLADNAELFLVAAELPEEGPNVFIVERDRKGLTTRAEPSMGVRAAAFGALELNGVRLSSDSLLDAPYEQIVDLAHLGVAALAVGTAQALLDYVIPYVNERVAFGEPISHRQSVAFLVANIAIELESMRLLVQRAASRAERSLPFHAHAARARVLTADKAMEIGANGVQLLGGHGFIKEHPVERWYRDLRSAAVMEGGFLP
jgi:alkylation response protein AidB-like acyl-CoA dehydrogenase